MKIRLAAAVLLSLAPLLAEADERQDYYHRAAATDLAVFRSLDRNGDGVVTAEEARGDVHFGSRFNDIDINRDGVVTLEELRRYIRLRYGVEPPA